MNIDEKKRLEVERDENRKTLEGLIHNIHDGLVIIDQDGVIREWNRAQEKITLIKRSQAIGKYIWDVQVSLSSTTDGLSSYLNNLKEAKITVKGSGVQIRGKELSPSILETLECGGLINKVRKQFGLELQEGK